MESAAQRVLRHAAAYGQTYRDRERPLHPAEDAAALRLRFDVGLPEQGRDPIEVIDALIQAAEPGLVGNTEAGFFSWVMGGSHPVGVAADWLTSVWGQNAGIFQCSPAAAIAEEACQSWLLDLLDLPRESSIGFTTGATMASFICLAAARGEVLRRAGHDFDRDGLCGCPELRIFISADAHVSNFAALRYLGIGSRALIPIATDDQGAMRPGALETALADHAGPAIVLCQAGNINSGAFDPFTPIAELARKYGAWLHIDGAFGLWARAVPEKKSLTAGVELADSWSIDGHKWLQVPYDSGFAIVRDAAAHRRAMDISASYLTESPGDGRNPTHYGPELSRRARGFPVWALLQALGREGVAEMVRNHCACAARIAARCDDVDGIRVHNRVTINQVVLSFRRFCNDADSAALTDRVTAALNATGRYFLRTADWKGQHVLRISVIAAPTRMEHVEALADDIEKTWRTIRAEATAATKPVD